MILNETNWLMKQNVNNENGRDMKLTCLLISMCFWNSAWMHDRNPLVLRAYEEPIWMISCSLDTNARYSAGVYFLYRIDERRRMITDCNINMDIVLYRKYLRLCHKTSVLK